MPLLKCERLDFRSGLGLQDIVVHSPLGYDRLNLDLVGDEREIPLIAPIFGHLVKQYDYVICDLPNEVSASVFACLVQSDKVFVISKYDDEHLYRTRLLLEDFRSHAAAREPEGARDSHGGRRGQRAVRRGGRAQGRPTDLVPVAVDSRDRRGARPWTARRT